LLYALKKTKKSRREKQTTLKTFVAEIEFQQEMPLSGQ